MASSLSNLVSHFAEGTHKIKCRYDMITKNLRCLGLSTKVVIVALNIQNLIVSLIEQKTNAYVVIKIAQKSLTKILKRDFLIRLFQQ